MKKIKNNICPKNCTCPNVKECNASVIEQIGYGFPIPTVEEDKCNYCEKCKAAELKYCSIDTEE